MLKKEDYLSTYDVSLDILHKLEQLSTGGSGVVERKDISINYNTFSNVFVPQFPAKGFNSVTVNVDVPWMSGRYYRVGLPENFKFGQFTEIPPYFDFSNCYNIKELFTDCSSLLKVDITFPSTAGDFNSLFYGCKNLETARIDLSGKYYAFSSIFMYCDSLKSVELLNTGNLSTFTWNFYHDKNLETINELDLHKVISSGQNFNGCVNLKNLGGFKGMREYLGLSTCTSLTHESLMNVINKVGNARNPGETPLHLGAENLAKLTQAEIQIAVDKGWVVS